MAWKMSSTRPAVLGVEHVLQAGEGLDARLQGLLGAGLVLGLQASGVPGSTSFRRNFFPSVTRCGRASLRARLTIFSSFMAPSPGRSSASAPDVALRRALSVRRRVYGSAPQEVHTALVPQARPGKAPGPERPAFERPYDGRRTPLGMGVSVCPEKRGGGAMRARAHGLFAAAAAWGLLCSCHRARDPDADRPGLIPAALLPSTALSSSPDLVALGRKTFEKECVACHGADGNGEGDAAYLLYPRPRDFTSGQFRIVSTWDNVPTDEDLFRTISRGMPGSAMPSWAHLPEETRWGLVHYVKSFSKQPLKVNASHEPDKFGNGGAGPIAVPPEPPYDDAARARAARAVHQGLRTMPRRHRTGRRPAEADRLEGVTRPARVI